MKPLPKLTEGDKAIFERARQENNPSWITNFYLRNEDSGTYWRMVTPKQLGQLELPESIAVAERWKAGYEQLLDIWTSLKSPKYFGVVEDHWEKLNRDTFLTRTEYLDRVYRVNFELDSNLPIFHYPHGVQFLPWQLDMHRSKHPIQVVVGGFGCIAPETRIYDADKEEYVTVSELFKQQRTIKVLAWDGDKFVKAGAGIPWIKGIADLYVVKLMNGSQITVTQDHRFLTPSGWKKLRDVGIGDVVLSYQPIPRRSSSVFCPSESQQDVPHWNQTVQGSQSDYHPYPHSYDGQPLGELDNDQDISPSQADVHAHSHENPNVGEMGSGYRHSHENNESHRSSLSFSPLTGRHAAVVEYGFYERSGELVLPEPLSLEDSQFQGMCVLDGQVLRSGPCTEVAKIDETYSGSSYSLIESIEYRRLGVFYDITVPFYENYLAEGFVNHNSAKTFGKSLSMMANAVSLPGYRALALAPFSKQAQEVHTIMLQIIQGTRFEKFLIASPTKPYPQLIFGNDYVGKTSIECFSCDDPDKFLTLTVDEALVDQAEQVDGNGTATIEELVRSLATRFRGTVRGRPRVGKITLSANSGDNPQLWDLYDEGATDPDYVMSMSPKTHDNIYLTVDDLIRYERVVGRDEVSRRMYLFGERPIGSGEHFPQESLEKCRARYLDDTMREELDKKTPGWMKLDAPRVATYRWEMPPQENHRYIVAADAGWANPPDRNAAVIGVWDITSFPTAPAVLTAFHWVAGNGSPNPWLAQYHDYVTKYKAVGLNGYDSTGTGAGYERMDVMLDLYPTPINMGGSNKMVFLNLTKKLMADGKLQIPSITHLFSQCAKYTVPDEKLRQDIVMMLLVTSALIEIFALYTPISEDTDIDYDPNDRYYRTQNDRDSEDDFFARQER